MEWSRYFAKVAAFPQMAMPGGRLEEVIAMINNSGMGVIGTPGAGAGAGAAVVEAVERIWLHAVDGS